MKERGGWGLHEKGVREEEEDGGTVRQVELYGELGKDCLIVLHERAGSAK